MPERVESHDRSQRDILWRIEDYFLDPKVPLEDSHALQEYLDLYSWHGPVRMQLLRSLETPVHHQAWADAVEQLLEEHFVPTVSEEEAQEYCRYRGWDPNETDWGKVAREVVEIRRRKIHLEIIERARKINPGFMTGQQPEGCDCFRDAIQTEGLFFIYFSNLEELLSFVAYQNQLRIRQYLFMVFADIRLKIQYQVRVPHRRLLASESTEDMNAGLISEQLSDMSHKLLSSPTPTLTQNLISMLNELPPGFSQQAFRNILIEALIELCRNLEMVS